MCCVLVVKENFFVYDASAYNFFDQEPLNFRLQVQRPIIKIQQSSKSQVNFSKFYCSFTVSLFFSFVSCLL